MNTLNDDALGTALKDAARRFEVPPRGAEQILGAATVASPAPRHGADRTSRGWSRQRLGLVAAVAIALAVLAGALLSSGLSANSFAPKLAGGPTSTTLPSHSLGGQSDVAYGSPGYVQSKQANGLSTSGRPSTSQGQALPQTKVVSVGSIAIRVGGGSFDSVLARISTLAVSAGGYVASSKSTAGSQAGGVPSAMIELRVPQKRFSSVVARAERLGRVVSAETNSTDVTAEYVDYQARIGAAKASRDQYLAIMARANSISDILAIQAQLNVIDSEIEQLEGQRNLLANQAAYGTLTIDVNQGAPAGGHTSGVLRSWNESISGFVAGVEWIIRAAGPALFALLCLAALLIFGRLGWRAGQRRFI